MTETTENLKKKERKPTFTDQVRKAEWEGRKQYSLFHPVVRNLFVNIYPTGEKRWQAKYKNPTNGKWTTKGLGEFGRGHEKPIIEEDDAVERKKALTKLADEGRVDPKTFEWRKLDKSKPGEWYDPAAEAKSKVAKLSMYSAVFEHRVNAKKHYKGLADTKSGDRITTRMLRYTPFEVWAMDAIEQASEICTLIKKVIADLEKGETEGAALHMHSDYCATYNYLIANKALLGIATDVINPFAGQIRPKAAAARHVTLTLPEIKRLWELLDTLPYVHRHLAAIIKIQLLTGLRIGEICGMRRGEIDLHDKVWTIPADRMKNNRVHLVYLSPNLFGIVQKLYYGTNHEVFFPQNIRGSEGVSRTSASLADTILTQHRSGVFFPVRDGNADEENRWCSHDIRRSFITHIINFADDFDLELAQAYLPKMIAHDRLKTGEGNSSELTVANDPTIQINYNKSKILPKTKKGWNQWDAFFQKFIIDGDMATLEAMQRAADGKEEDLDHDEIEKLAA